MSMTKDQIEKQKEHNEEFEEYREDFQAKLEDWLDMPEPIGVKEKDLDEALYSFDQNDIFYDGDPISNEQAIQCWKIVQRVRLSGFPEELRM